MTQSNKIYVGVDVSKFKWDVALSNSKTVHSFKNNPEGEQQLLQLLSNIDVEIVCLEATGNYEYRLVELLHEHHYPLAIVNPRLPRDFARSMNLLAKTDAIDARVLALFAERYQLTPHTKTPEILLKIQALVTRRRQLVQQRTQELNRKDTLHDRDMLQDIEHHLDYLKQRIKRIEQQIKELIAQQSDLKERVDLLVSVPGIGQKTAQSLTTELPELGQLNRQEVARLTGLAPINRDSGTFRGKQMIGGGRTHVRTSLYMPTLVAIRHNPKLKAFYQHLLAQGKCKMVAIVACMRKLITLLNTLVKNKTPWKSTNIH